MTSTSTPRRGPVSRFADFLRSDTVGGFPLIGAALLALVWIDSPLGGIYGHLRAISFGPEALNLHLSLETRAADGLLAALSACPSWRASGSPCRC